MIETISIVAATTCSVGIILLIAFVIGMLLEVDWLVYPAAGGLILLCLAGIIVALIALWTVVLA